jgi:hypothetical protein
MLSNDAPPEFRDSLLLRVGLRNIAPLIWRSLEVPACASLEQLHETLQIAFGWTNSHLHEFEVNGIRFGMADVDEEADLCVDERAAPLGALAKVGATFTYRYDFGDDWEHDVTVEAIVRGGEFAIECTAGERAAPPEDCGGPGGYAQVCEALNNRAHVEHPSIKEWAGRKYDAERFDLAATNRKLGTLTRRLRKAWK